MRYRFSNDKTRLLYKTTLLWLDQETAKLICTVYPDDDF